MLPSRGPIQVTLEDTGSRPIQCKPPTQVKILRRPKPSAVDPKPPTASSQPDSTSNHKFNSISLTQPSTNNQTSSHSDNLFDDRLLGELDNQELDFPPLPSMATTITNHNYGAQQTQKGNRNMAHLNGQLERQLKLQDQDHSQNHHNNDQLHTNHRIQSTGSSGINSNGKNPIKTYQERADEYAKARLRILGSAFPESDQSLVNGSDIDCGIENGLGSGDRLSNLNFKAALSSSSSCSPANGNR